MEMPLDLFCLDDFLAAKHTGLALGGVGTWRRTAEEGEENRTIPPQQLVSIPMSMAS